MELFYSDSVEPIVEELFKLEQYTQRTPEWLEARMKCITASDIATVLKQSEKTTAEYIRQFNIQNFKVNPKKSCNPYNTEKEFILKKCGLGTPFLGNQYTYWGQKYEPIVTCLYQQKEQVDVLEFGLLFHPKVSFLAASPDGITSKGVMLEIKCPSRRQVHTVPPLEYFHQMQLQMEVCGLDECDFFDASFMEYHHEDDWLAAAQLWWQENPDSSFHLFGIILSIVDEDQEPPVYVYAPLSVKTIAEFQTWANTTNNQGYMEGISYDYHYYHLEKYHQVRVKADKNWLTNNLEDLDQIWKKVIYHRTDLGKEELVKKNTRTSAGVSASSSGLTVKLTDNFKILDLSKKKPSALVHTPLFDERRRSFRIKERQKV